MPDPTAPAGAVVPSAEAEAARYALLRRLAPSMRHHLVVNLQPIGMIYEVMERRLRAPQPDLRHVHDSASKINGFAKAALNSCLDVVSWLAPDDSATVAVDAAVRECAALLATSLGFRGYALRNEVGPLDGVVQRSGIRAALSGALVHATDHVDAPADLTLTAAAEDAFVRVSVRVAPAGGERGMAGEANYRKLSWSDLQALAAADGVQLSREGERIDLRLPWVR
ncbi:MAG TPA: hypothetical protein VNB23_01555 [Ramlibacter sp.]|nr:hypothetical protein [Ramlibacter sp.]